MYLCSEGWNYLLAISDLSEEMYLIGILGHSEDIPIDQQRSNDNTAYYHCNPRRISSPATTTFPGMNHSKRESCNIQSIILSRGIVIVIVVVDDVDRGKY